MEDFELRDSESLTSLGHTWNPLEHSDSLRWRCRSTEPIAAGNTVLDSLDPVPYMKTNTEARWWKETKDRPFVTSRRKFLALVLDEIRQSAHGTGRLRHLGRFFNIVRGGNVHLVKDVLDSLRAMGLHRELAWVLGTKDEQELPAVTDDRCTSLMKVIHPVMCAVWSLLFFLLTPIFYLIQIVIHSIHYTTRPRISQNIDLPLVFALLSEEEAMVSCFLEAGCPITRQDEYGNNIYHYLSDLSVDKPEKAVRCHRVLCNLTENVHILRSLITEQKNLTGMSALETIAKYGSPHFLRFIMVDKSCIGTLRLGVSKNRLWVSEDGHTFDMNSLQSVESSLLLDAEEGSQEAPISSLNVWEFDISDYESGDIYGKQSYLLQLVAGRSVEGMSETDVNGLVNSKLLDRWFTSKLRQYSPFAVVGHTFYLVITILLLAFVMLHGGDVDPTPLYGTFIRLEFQELRKAGESASENTLQKVSLWNDTCHEWPISVQDEILGLVASAGVEIDNCTASALVSLRHECDGLEPSYILGQTLNHTDQTMKTNPTRKVLDYAILVHVVLDMVVRQGFLFCNYNFKSNSIFLGILPVLLRRLPGSYTEQVVSYLMYSLYVGFLVTNQIWAQAVNTRNYKFGQYLAYINTSKDLVDHGKVAVNLDREIENVATMATLAGNLVIICLMLRFLHSIHALRLLPGVGFFVITTKKMAKHLMQFTVIFCIVSVAFATIFLFVMRQNGCPTNKLEGFRTLWASLFSTYQVALGYGEYDFKVNINAIIAYLAYTIISILLLLNLVIAVMTTTVEELNQSPWKGALCCVERWDEILGTEVMVQTMLIPVSCLVNTARSLSSFCQQKHIKNWENIRMKTKQSFEVVYFE